MKHQKKSVLILVCMLLLAALSGPAVAVDDSFVFATIESERRQYSSYTFNFPPGHPWADDSPRWFLKAASSQLGDNPFNVTVTTPIGPIDIDYIGPFNSQAHFSVSPILPDYLNGPITGPDYYSDWDNRDYTFTMGNATQVWNIPENGLSELPLIAPTSQGDENPTLTWNPVAGVDAYQIMISAWRPDNLPDLPRSLYLSDFIMDDGRVGTYSWTYTGDLLKKGIDMPFWVRAIQFHPQSAQGNQYYQRTLNMSSYIFSLRGHRPIVEQFNNWNLGGEGGATATIDPQDNTRAFLNAPSDANDEAYAEGSRMVDGAIGIMADVVVTNTVSPSGDEWGCIGLRMNVGDRPSGTYVTAQIRLEWSGGNTNIHCRVRERNAKGKLYKEISRMNFKNNWWNGLKVPMGVAVVNNSVAFWAEGRGMYTVPLPKDITLRKDPVRFFTSADPGPFTIEGIVEDVRIPTKENPLIFGDIPSGDYDVNGDGKKGLEEAIDALQTVAAVPPPPAAP